MNRMNGYDGCQLAPNIRQESGVSYQESTNLADYRLLTTYYCALVELTGIEPVASWLQTRRSPS
jgi:hypothetical protein